MTSDLTTPLRQTGRETDLNSRATERGKDASMLVLSRKRNAKFVIAKDGEILATVVVVEIRGDKVRIGIDAPSSYAVRRLEVWEAIQRNDGVEVKRPAAEATA